MQKKILIKVYSSKTIIKESEMKREQSLGSAEQQSESVYGEVIRGLVTGNSSSNVGQLKQYLNDRLIEREKEVLAVMAGLFSNEPVLLLGPVGTGKTKLVETLGEAINGKYYYYLLHQFMEPDELLGPPNVKKYIEEGKYERSDSGGLQHANVVFFDEPFKASSPVRNMLLDIILYKRYKSGDSEVKLPILGMFMAANELPEDEEDAAFKDRLVIKVFVSPLSQEGRQKMLKSQGESDADSKSIKKIMSIDEVKAMQEETAKRAESAKSNDKLMASFGEAMAEIQKNGVVTSDRTYKKIWKVAASVSLALEEKEMTSEDIAIAMFLCAPNKAEDRAVIEDAISKTHLSAVLDSAKVIFTVKTEVSNGIKNTSEAAQRFAEKKAARDRLQVDKNQFSMDYFGALSEYVQNAENLRITVDQAKEIEKKYQSAKGLDGFNKQLGEQLAKAEEQIKSVDIQKLKNELEKEQKKKEKSERNGSPYDQFEVQATIQKAPLLETDKLMLQQKLRTLPSNKSEVKAIADSVRAKMLKAERAEMSERLVFMLHAESATSTTVGQPVHSEHSKKPRAVRTV